MLFEGGACNFCACACRIGPGIGDREKLRGGGRGSNAKPLKMTSAALQDRKRRISAELEPPRGEEEEEDVIGPKPAEPAKGTKKRKGERADDGGKFKYSCSN